MKTLEKIKLKIKKLPHAYKNPAYATPGSSGMDLYAAIEGPVTLKPLDRYAIPTGLVCEVPEGFEIQLRARSGLALKYGITLANGIGTVDSDYRGEIKVIVINLGQKSYTFNPGDRIAQLVVSSVVRPDIEVVEELTDTCRADGGFGSTGI